MDDSLDWRYAGRLRGPRLSLPSFAPLCPACVTRSTFSRAGNVKARPTARTRALRAARLASRRRCRRVYWHWWPLVAIGRRGTHTHLKHTDSLTHTHALRCWTGAAAAHDLPPASWRIGQPVSQPAAASPAKVGRRDSGWKLQDERGPNPLFVVHPCICIWTGARAAPVAAPLAVPALHFRATRSLHALKSLEIGGIALNRTQI